MLIKTNLSVSGPLSLSSVSSTTTSLSAMILESGLVKSRILGSMSLKGDNEYLPQISLSFPNIFNLNTSILDFTNQSLTVSLANQTAKTFFAAPNGLSGTPSFRAIVASDIPTLNQSTTGNAATATKLQTARTINGTSFNGSSNITTSNWGTGRTITIGTTGKTVNGSGNVSWSLTEIGATTVGSNLFGLVNPSAISFIRINADNSISTLNATDFRTAIGVGTGSGTVTSVSGTGTVSGLTLTGTVTASGNLTLGGTLTLTASQVNAVGTITNSTTGNAASATSVGITNTTTSGTYYPLFASATSGNQVARVDTGLTYNPGTDTLSTGVSTATSAYRGGNGTASLPAYSFSGDTNTGMYWMSADTLGFATGGANRMRIDSAGRVIIGNTVPFTNSVFTIGGSDMATSAHHIFQVKDIDSEDIVSVYGALSDSSMVISLGDYNDAYGYAYMKMFSGYTVFGKQNIGIDTTPSYPLHVGAAIGSTSIYATGDIIAYSDQSVKENIRPIENVLERVNNSRGVLYDRIDNESKDNIGFIAQELEENFPELVITNEDGTKAVKYQNAVAVLFEAIKEQQKEIEKIKQILNGITN